MKAITIFWLGFIYLWCCVSAERGPCSGSSRLGDSCEQDDDCSGTAVVCRSKVCTCHENYYKETEDGSSKCVKAPDKIDAACPLPSRVCKPPLTCDQGKCKCLNAKKVGKNCVLEAKHGVACTSNKDCILPFTSCQDRKCLCLGGRAPTKNGRCDAAQHCPDGTRHTGQQCSIVNSDPDIVLNTANTGGTFDEGCKAGEYCVTDGFSKQGFCCKASCPYNYAPSGTCDQDNQCPSTHYCHRLVGPGFSFSVCCVKPCRDPKPIFRNGTCYSVSSSNEDCQFDAECDGGLTMECTNGRCRCRSGFRESRDGIASRLVCIKECAETQASVGTQCFSKSALGSKCVMDWQCPENSECFEGKCACKCNYKAEGSVCKTDEDSNILSGLKGPQDKGDGKKDGGIFGQLLGGLLGGGNG